MHRSHRYIVSLFLTAVLAVPVAIMAAPAPQSVQVKVYDSNHKDYHNWDDHENQVWGQFLVENHKKPHDYKKANKKEQGQYWDYRHTHQN